MIYKLNNLNIVDEKKRRDNVFWKALETFGILAFQQQGFTAFNLNDSYSGGGTHCQAVLADFFASKDEITFFIEAKARHKELYRGSIEKPQISRILAASLNKVPCYYLVCIYQKKRKSYTVKHVLEEDIYLVSAHYLLQWYFNAGKIGFIRYMKKMSIIEDYTMNHYIIDMADKPKDLWVRDLLNSWRDGIEQLEIPEKQIETGPKEILVERLDLNSTNTGAVWLKQEEAALEATRDFLDWEIVKAEGLK